jgi:hypothetical protein
MITASNPYITWRWQQQVILSSSCYIWITYCYHLHVIYGSLAVIIFFCIFLYITEWLIYNKYDQTILSLHEALLNYSYKGNHVQHYVLSLHCRNCVFGARLSYVIFPIKLLKFGSSFITGMTTIPTFSENLYSLARTVVLWCFLCVFRHLLINHQEDTMIKNGFFRVDMIPFDAPPFFCRIQNLFLQIENISLSSSFASFYARLCKLQKRVYSTRNRK